MHEKPSPFDMPTIAQISSDQQDRILGPVRALITHYKRRTAELRHGQKSDVRFCHKRVKNSTATSKSHVSEMGKRNDFPTLTVTNTLALPSAKLRLGGMIYGA